MSVVIKTHASEIRLGWRVVACSACSASLVLQHHLLLTVSRGPKNPSSTCFDTIVTVCMGTRPLNGVSRTRSIALGPSNSNIPKKRSLYLGEWRSTRFAESVGDQECKGDKGSWVWAREGDCEGVGYSWTRVWSRDNYQLKNCERYSRIPGHIRVLFVYSQYAGKLNWGVQAS
jgi:hypothetical protein